MTNLIDKTKEFIEEKEIKNVVKTLCDVRKRDPCTISNSSLIKINFAEKYFGNSGMNERLNIYEKIESAYRKSKHN